MDPMRSRPLSNSGTTEAFPAVLEKRDEKRFYCPKGCKITFSSYLECSRHLLKHRDVVKEFKYAAIGCNRAEANAQGGYYGNTLQAASARGDQQIVKLLLDQGAEVNVQGGDFGNALQAASAGGHQQIVKLLLDHGADVNAQGGHFGNALQAASSARGDQQIVKLLLDHGADVNAQSGHFGNALQAASARGDQQIVKLLLNHGADVNAQGGDFGNALQAASAERHEQIVKLLLDQGAEVNAQGGYYGNALQAASVGGNQQIVKLLLDQDAFSRADKLRAHQRYVHQKQKDAKESEQKRHEMEGLAVQGAAIRKPELSENPHHQNPTREAATSRTALKPPRIDYVINAHLPSEQSQKPSPALLDPRIKIDSDDNVNYMPGVSKRSGSPQRAIVSVESQQPLVSSENMRGDIGKEFGSPKHLQSDPVFPIPLPPDDRPLEVQLVQAEPNIYNLSMRGKSTKLSTKLAHIALSLPTLSDGPAPSFEHVKAGLGTRPPVRPTERTNGVEKLDTLQPERMEQAESHSLSTSNKPISGLESSGGSSAGDAEEEDRSFIETDGEGDAASECEVSVKSALDTAMNVVKGLLLRELLDYALPEATDALDSPSSASHASSAGGSTSSSLSSCTSNSKMLQRKRLRGKGRDPGDGEGDDSDDNDRPKKRNEKGSLDRLSHRRLKCPFYQREPEKYTKAACRGEGFADMAKLKDHIKRVHTQPLRCSRCWLEMKSEDAFSEHLQQENICTKSAEPQEDRIRPQLLKRLDFKKAPYANARNVDEKWNMLFSVLFPNDTNIPSPYEQHGMSPRLERALSEALEEELTRELTPLLEPIMSRIKALIPVIIESCRLKLIRSSPFSDDETVFTPSAVSSGAGSSGSEIGSSKKPAKHGGSLTASRCSGSIFEVGPIPEVLSSKAWEKQPQRTVPSTSDINIESRQQVSTLETSINSSIFQSGAASETPNIHGSNIDDSFDTGSGCGFFTRLEGFSNNGMHPATEGSSTAPANTRGMAFGHYSLVEALPHQSNLCVPESELWTPPLAGAGLNPGSGQARGEQPGDTVPPEQEPPPEWELMMKDFDFSNFTNC